MAISQSLPFHNHSYNWIGNLWASADEYNELPYNIMSTAIARFQLHAEHFLLCSYQKVQGWWNHNQQHCWHCNCKIHQRKEQCCLTQERSLFHHPKWNRLSSKCRYCSVHHCSCIEGSHYHLTVQCLQWDGTICLHHEGPLYQKEIFKLW